VTRFKRGGKGVSAPAPPARRVSSFPYEGATSGRRLGTWSTTRDAVNTVWYQSADQLVSRSRDSARKDGWAAKTIDEWVCNAVGNGIKPQSLHSTPATKEKIQKLWSQFVTEADAGGLTDLYGLQALAFRSMVEGGECFARKHIRPISDGLTIPLQLQLIETEQLPFYLARPTPETPKGNVVRASIEFDQRGRRTAYYFYKEHPGERLFFPNYLDLIRVPTDEVMHLFRPLRPGQLRGVGSSPGSPLRVAGSGSNLSDGTLLEVTVAGELILAGGAGNGYRFADLGSASNPSGWAGVIKVKTPAGATAGYILLYSNP